MMEMDKTHESKGIFFKTKLFNSKLPNPLNKE